MGSLCILVELPNSSYSR